MADVIAADGKGEPSPTIDAAKTAIEGLLSREEKSETRETKPPKSKAEPAAALEGADADEAEETTDSEEAGSEDTETADAEQPEEKSDDAEDVPDDTPVAKKFTVKVDGKDEEVDEDELKGGYLRTKDYTHKTQALAAERKKFEAEEVSAVRAERQQYADNLATIEEAVKSLVGTEPHWETLRNTLSPAEFAAQRADWDINQDRLAGIAKEKARVAALQGADNEKALSAHIESETALLLEALPTWKNAEVRKKEQTLLTEFAKSRGFSEQDLHAVRDHRLLVLINDARLYTEGKTKAVSVQDKIKRAADATKSTAHPSPRTTSAETKALQRLAKTGRQEDAAAAIALRIG